MCLISAFDPRKKSCYYSHRSFSLLSRTICFLPKACADAFCCHLWPGATDSFLVLSDLFRRRAAHRGQSSMVAVSLNFLQGQNKASKCGQTFITRDVCIVVVLRCSLISSGSQLLLLLGSFEDKALTNTKTGATVCSTVWSEWQLGLFHSCSSSHVQKVSIAV